MYRSAYRARGSMLSSDSTWRADGECYGESVREGRWRFRRGVGKNRGKREREDQGEEMMRRVKDVGLGARGSAPNEHQENGSGRGGYEVDD